MQHLVQNLVTLSSGNFKLDFLQTHIHTPPCTLKTSHLAKPNLLGSRTSCGIQTSPASATFRYVTTETETPYPKKKERLHARLHVTIAKILFTQFTHIRLAACRLQNGNRVCGFHACNISNSYSGACNTGCLAWIRQSDGPHGWVVCHGH